MGPLHGRLSLSAENFFFNRFEKIKSERLRLALDFFLSNFMLISE